MPYFRTLPVGFSVLTFHFTIAGDPDPASCTFGVDHNTQPTVANANEMFLAWSLNIGPRTSTQLTLTKVSFLYQADAVNQVLVESTQAPTAGTRTGTVLPSNCAFLIEKVTLFAGRRNRGRFYVPLPLEADVDTNGIISQAELANWATPLLNFFAAQNVVGSVDDVVILHSCFNADPDNDPPCLAPLPTAIVSYRIDNVIGTQRRRMR